MAYDSRQRYLRFALTSIGCKLRKSRRKNDDGRTLDQGGFAVERRADGALIFGAQFDKTLEEIESFVVELRRGRFARTMEQREVVLPEPPADVELPGLDLASVELPDLDTSAVDKLLADFDASMAILDEIPWHPDFNPPRKPLFTRISRKKPEAA
jgi:hypothetical protein